MRFIAGALVVLAGVLLWATAIIGASMIYAAGRGNLGRTDMASTGGMVIVAAGLVILVLAHLKAGSRE